MCREWVLNRHPLTPRRRKEKEWERDIWQDNGKAFFKAGNTLTCRLRKFSRPQITYMKRTSYVKKETVKAKNNFFATIREQRQITSKGKTGLKSWTLHNKEESHACSQWCGSSVLKASLLVDTPLVPGDQLCFEEILPMKSRPTSFP